MKYFEIIIFIIVIVIVIYLLNRNGRDIVNNDVIKEDFNPWLDYGRAYPGTFSFRNGYGQFYRPFYNAYPGNVRYNPSYSDYWYIPAQEYLSNWMGISEEGKTIPNSCIVPPITSENCMQKQFQQTGNLDLSIAKCTVPATVSDACPLLTDWTGPLTYYNNDYAHTNIWV